jgi:hypothetical protein
LSSFAVSWRLKASAVSPRDTADPMKPGRCPAADPPSELTPALLAVTALDADWQAAEPGCGSDRSSSAPPPRHPSTCGATGMDDHNRRRSWWGGRRGGAWSQPGPARQDRSRLRISLYCAAWASLPESSLWPTARRWSPSSGPQARAQAFHRGIRDHVMAMDRYAFVPDREP